MEDEIGFRGLMPQWRYGQCNLAIPKNDYLTLPCHGQGKNKAGRVKDKIVQCSQLLWQMSGVREVVDSGDGVMHRYQRLIQATDWKQIAIQSLEVFQKPSMHNTAKQDREVSDTPDNKDKGPCCSCCVILNTHPSSGACTVSLHNYRIAAMEAG